MVEVPKSATYYVRTALQVAINHMEEKLKWLLSVRDDPTDPVPNIWKETLRGEIAYTSQWLQEAKEEFAKLPEEVRPWPKPNES